jgi:hypothetical protein
MLVYQDDTNVFPRLCKILERIFDPFGVRLAVDDQKVPLPFSAGHYMLLPF